LFKTYDSQKQMSAQAHTNKMRILAEASLVKVQYPGKVGLNNNPIYSTINCSPDFRVLKYSSKPVCCNIVSIPIAVPIIPPIIPPSSIILRTNLNVGNFRINFTSSLPLNPVVNGLSSLTTISNTNPFQYDFVINNVIPGIEYTITGLDGITTLSCENMDVTDLDVSSLTTLENLLCGFNLLTSLNVSSLTNLKILSCGSNSLRSLTSLPLGLTLFDCSINNLQSIDVSNLINLQFFSCGSNQIRSLTNFPSSLKILNCQINQISSLTNLPSSLTQLECGANLLTTLVVSSLINLTILTCAFNRLPIIDISPLRLLTYFDCNNNLINLSNAQAIVNNLPDRSTTTSGQCNIQTQPGGPFTLTVPPLNWVIN